jgi:TPR repeat protein
VRWFRLAADQGDFDGQYELALIYQVGRGVPQDYVEAYKWFSLAAAQDDSFAVRGLNDMTALMTPAQIAEGQRLAAEWQPRSPE